MAVLIPLAAYAGVVLSLAAWRPAWDWRKVALRAAVLWACWAVATVEVLSPGRGISPLSLGLSWSVLLVGAVASLGWMVRRGRRVKWRGLRWPEGWVDWGIEGALVAVLAVTALIAWLAPPSTWDSLNYHMPRVAHWAQNGSLRPFATGIEVQNSRTPGAELLVLNLYVLAGGDRLANFVGWFAFAASALAAGLIARQLGGGRRAQLSASLLSASIPMAIAQASSTMTDGVVGLWSMCAVSEALGVAKGEREAAWWAGAAAGLGLLTKPTAAAYLLPVGLWAAMATARQMGWRKGIAVGGATVVLVVVLSGGHIARNVSIYGTALDPYQIEVHSNGLRNARGLLSNLSRNLGMQIGTPSSHINRGIYLVVARIHEWMGLDLNDTRTTSAGRFAVRPSQTHEDLATNPLHSWVYLLAFGAILARRGTRGSPQLPYALAAVGALLVLSYLFKWQIFGSRYLLPFFVLFSPVAACAIDSLGWRGLSAVVSLGLAVASWPWLTGIRSRPLIERPGESYVRSVLVESRARLYFANGLYLQDPLSEMAAEIESEGCGSVALILGGNQAEYPIWVLLGAPREDMRIEWIVAGTPSSRFVDPSLEACAVICDDACPADWGRIRGLTRVYEESGFRLFMGRPN